MIDDTTSHIWLRVKRRIEKAVCIKQVLYKLMVYYTNPLISGLLGWPRWGAHCVSWAYIDGQNSVQGYYSGGERFWVRFFRVCFCFSWYKMCRAFFFMMARTLLVRSLWMDRQDENNRNFAYLLLRFCIGRYPILLSLENHCKHDQQVKMAQYIKVRLE